MNAVLVTLHLLAAAVWIGGTVALVFVGVPVVRTLEGETRARSMRMLGQRWRPIGYGSLAVASLTGLVLAGRDAERAEDGFEAVLTAKFVVVGLLVLAAWIHDFRLGPRLAKEIREGQPQRTRPRLVAVGWFSFAMTIAAPVLGVALMLLAR